MRNSEKNVKTILEILIKGEDFITLEYLASKIGISKRSVQNYLVKVDKMFEENNFSDIILEKKQGYGIRLDVTPLGRKKLSEFLKDEKFNAHDGSFERRIEILKSLLFYNEELTIQYLADQFYISRTNILYDLEWIEKWLLQYKLHLFKTQRRGIGIIGDEVSRRTAIAGIFDIRKMEETSFSRDSIISQRVTQTCMEKLKSVYKEKDIQKICSIIEKSEKEFDFFLIDEYYESLLTHILISVFRLQRGNRVKKEFLPPDGEFPQLEMNTAIFIAKELEKSFGIECPELERIYICIHLLSFNTFHDIENNNIQVSEKVEILALQLIDSVDAELGTTYSTDKILFFGLLFHLKSSIYRLKQNFYSKNTNDIIMNQIEEDLLSTIQKSNGLYKEFCGVVPDALENISIASYFMLSQKRHLRRKKSLLVCNFDVISQFELLQYLEKRLLQIELIDVCASCQFYLYPTDSFEFIISTVTLENCEKPIADISHISKNKYVEFIEEFLFVKYKE